MRIEDAKGVSVPALAVELIQPLLGRYMCRLA